MPVTIVCKLKRAGGTEVPLYGKDYHFKPKDAADLKAPHICEIPDEDAAQIWRFLQIKEGYELLDPNAKLPPRPTPSASQTMAADKAAANTVEPVIIEAPDGTKINLTAMQPEELRAFAKEEFGISVHHKWNDQTVIGKIIERARGEE